MCSSDLPGWLTLSPDMTNATYPFPELLEAVRRRDRMGYEELANRAWTSQGCLHRVCPVQDMVIRLCLALGQSLEETDVLLQAASHVSLLDLGERGAPTRARPATSNQSQP